MAMAVRIVVSKELFFQINTDERFNYAAFVQSVKDQQGFFDGKAVWVPLHSISHTIYMDVAILDAALEAPGQVKN